MPVLYSSKYHAHCDGRVSDKETVTDVNWMELATMILRLQCKHWNTVLMSVDL